ncbi:MAG: hypothetical protein ACYDGM_10375 [Vulcanimicrobiaceae bacterium]
MRHLRGAWLFVLLAVLSLAATAFAQVRGVPPHEPIDRVTMPPVTVTMPPVGRPIGIPTPPGVMGVVSQYIGAVAPGTKVPLSRLPMLPQRTSLNTVTPKMARAHVHPLAANGAYIDVSNTNCFAQGALGDNFNVGCSLQWYAASLPNGDTYQDYYVFATNGNELNASATAVGGTHGGGNGPGRATTLSAAGTYIFGAYDVSKGQWAAIIYVNAGQVFTIKVYQDAFHSQETYQFDASSSNNAYIYLQNVSQSDYYVVGITQTSVAPNCVFIAPAPLPYPYTPPANQLCNLTASAGVQAPGGNLSVTWPIGPTLKAGIYSIEVYDLTQGVRLGQVQVSLTGAGGLVLITRPDGTGPNINPSPAVIPAPTPATIIAWDGNNPIDESATGVSASISGATNGTNYKWTLSDPQGQVLSSVAGTIAGNVGSNVFTFDNTAMLQPGSYPSHTFSVQLYDTTNNDVVASQSFQVLGYSTTTQFNNAGTLGSTISITPNSQVTEGLRFTNNGGGIYNGFGDNLSKIIFTSGPNFNVSNTTGNGIMMSVVNGATNPCGSCTTTTTDSNGNTWNATVTCSATTKQKNGECNLELDPSSSNITLAPGAYINLNNVTFFSATGSTCGNSCQALTSEFPQHGLTWSNTTSALAWQPVYFRNSSATESGTANFQLVGSYNQGAYNLNPGPPFSPPFVGTHFFLDPFMHADYNNNSPYDVPISLNNPAASNQDITLFTIKNTGTNKLTEVAIQLPPLYLNQGFYSIDPATPGAWNYAACPANFSVQWICFNNGNVAAGGTDYIYVDLTMTLQSFPFQDIAMQGYANSQWFAMTPSAGSNTTPDGRNTLDNLSFGVYSLIGSDMTTYFSPSTVGQGSTATLGASVQNTSTSVDPNPDSLDIVVLEAPSTGLTLSSTPSVTPAGWSYLGQFKKNGATATQYWFGLCTNQFGAASNGTYGGPPTANGGGGVPLAGPYPSPPPCTAAQETNAAPPGQTVTVSNMQFTNFNTVGTQTWHMYAHGANAGGWSAAQPFSLTVTAESASIWFNQVDGTTVASNTIPTIGGSPNTYQYAVKNTSQSSAISTTVITIPGLDTNNQNATDSSGNTWNVTNIATGGVTLSAPGGQADGTGGCVVDTSATKTFNPTTAGANGQITLDGCTSFKPGDIIYVNFAAANPEVQSDSYLFPATVDGSNAGPAWLGADEISVQFTIGLDIVVDPSNPGPGGSTPVVNCANPCAFSGTTVDFGNIANNTAFNFLDVVRASVYYTGATTPGHNLLLQVSANSNPTNSTGTPTNEMLTDIDGANSTQGAGITFNQTSMAVVPTTGGLLVGTVPETNRSTPYDLIQSYQIAIGNETITAHIVTVTYTLIPN